jgi:hypothetical protein
MVEEAPAQVVAVHDRLKWVMPLHSTTSDVLIIEPEIAFI